jgi:hypothetical protein
MLIFQLKKYAMLTPMQPCKHLQQINVCASSNAIVSAILPPEQLSHLEKIIFRYKSFLEYEASLLRQNNNVKIYGLQFC